MRVGEQLSMGVGEYASRIGVTHRFQLTCVHPMGAKLDKIFAAFRDTAF